MPGHRCGGQAGGMTNSSQHHITAAVVLAACVLAGSGCGGGSSAASHHDSHATTSTPEPTGPCKGDRPILFLEGAVCADGTADAAAVTSGAGNTWSPNGDRQAYVSANATTLIVRDQAGTDRKLYRAPKKISLVHRVAWSPDGSRLAVLMLDERGFSDFGIFVPGQKIPSYKPSLAVIDAATGRLVRRVPLSPAIVNMPYITNPPDTLAFSPDGSQVLVSWDSPAVIDVAGGRVHRLWSAPAVAAWASAGQVIFLDVINRSRFGAMHSWSVADGGHVIWPKRSVAQLGIVAEHGLEYGQMRVSPDGARIAIRTSEHGQTGIAIASWTGTSIGEDIDLTLIPGHIWDFDWSPDSTRVAAVVIDGSTAEIQVLQTTKSTWTTVGTIPITIDGPDTIDALGPIKKIGWAG
jgi:WD40 repeat protein